MDHKENVWPRMEEEYRLVAFKDECETYVMAVPLLASWHFVVLLLCIIVNAVGR